DDGHFEKSIFRQDGIITTRESSENADRMVAVQIRLLADGAVYIASGDAIERGVGFIETGHLDFPELVCSLQGLDARGCIIREEANHACGIRISGDGIF